MLPEPPGAKCPQEEMSETKSIPAEDTIAAKVVPSKINQINFVF